MAEITEWVKKVWKNRITEFPTRRTLTKEDGSSEIVTVTRNEGTVSEEGDAFDANTMNDLEERIDAGFTELNGKLKPKLLWTNPDNTVAFNAQTIELDLSIYSCVIIEFKFAINTDYYEECIAPIDGQYHLGHAVAYRIHYRGFTPSAAGIIFDTGVEVFDYGKVTKYQNDAIPNRIYGVM